MASALAALSFAVIAAIAGALVVRRRRDTRLSSEESARYENLLATARASFTRAIREIDALEERDAETGAEARLSVAVLAKKIEGIERDVAEDPRRRAHEIVVERLTRVAGELDRVARELKDARPKKQLSIIDG